MKRAVVVWLVAVGCDGPADTGSTAAPITCKAPVEVAGGAYTPPDTCTSMQSQLVGFVGDPDDFRRRVVGPWVSCTSPSVWGTTDEVGFTVNGDGTWAKLYADAGGHVTPSTDATTSGTYTIEGDGAEVAMQLELARASDGAYIVVNPYFADTPAMMRITNEGIYTADYIRDDSSGRCSAATPDPAPGAYTEPAACAAFVAGAVATDEAAARATLLGRWDACGTDSPFATDTDDGIEFLADGTFYRLYAAADGTLQRAHGFSRQGTWKAFATSPGGNVQLNLETADGTIVSIPQLGTSPTSLVIDNEGVHVGRYVHE